MITAFRHGSIIFLYATIIFAVYYMFNYEVFSAGKSQIDEYDSEMQAYSLKKAQLEASGAFVTEENVTRLIDLNDLESGKDILQIKLRSMSWS